MCAAALLGRGKTAALHGPRPGAPHTRHSSRGRPGIPRPALLSTPAVVPPTGPTSLRNVRSTTNRSPSVFYSSLTCAVLECGVLGTQWSHYLETGETGAGTALLPVPLQGRTANVIVSLLRPNWSHLLSIIRNLICNSAGGPAGPATPASLPLHRYY